MHLLTWVGFGLLGYVPNTLYTGIRTLGTGNIKPEDLPVTFWYLVHARFETIRVIPLITAVTKQQLIFVITTQAKLAVLEQQTHDKTSSDC
jgi:hypothetical protein